MRDDISANMGIFLMNEPNPELKFFLFIDYSCMIKSIVNVKIGNAVWNQINSKDIRDAIKMTKLTK
jgi:hypothetical protein